MTNKKDPICGMNGTIKKHGYLFCSESCIRKYELLLKEKKIRPTCEVKPVPWYREKVAILLIITLALLVMSFIFHPLRPLYYALIEYVKLIWWAILLGILLGGVIDYFIPDKYIMKLMGTHEKRTIFYAVGLGFLMSACSHGILALAMELYKKGGSTASVIAFLMASPWANLPITILFFGFFGWKAFLIIISAIIIAIITGFIYMLLERKKLVECDKCGLKHDANFSIMKDMKRRMKRFKWSSKDVLKAVKGVVGGGWALTKMVGWWILVGMIVASLARAFVPNNFFIAYMGATFLGMVVVLVLATVIEVCSEGSAPMAFEIFNQTGAFGNSFVFLMAGVATDYTEIGLIWSNIGKKAALWLPVITIPQILLFGYLFNVLL